MRLISAANSRFTRSYGYTLPELKPSMPRASRRIAMITPETHHKPEANGGRQERRR